MEGIWNRIVFLCKRFTNKILDTIFGASLRLVIFIFSGTTVVAGLSIGSYNSIRLITYHKNRDATAMTYFNMEKIAEDLSQYLKSIYSEKQNKGSAFIGETYHTKKPSFAAKLDKGKLDWLGAKIANIKHLKDLGFKKKPSDKIMHIVQIEGYNYLVLSAKRGEASLALSRWVPAGNFLLFWEFDLEKHISRVFSYDDQYTYIGNRNGQLIYSNSRAINDEGFSKRVLVQNYIKSPHSQGHLSIKNSGSSSTKKAFFYAVPFSNIALFTEIKEDIITDKVVKAQFELISIQAIVVLFCLIIGEIVLYFIFRPLASVTRAAQAFAKGEFDTEIDVSSLGEIRILTKVLNETGSKLKEREENLLALHKANERKAYLAHELELAAEIQQNLLPQFDIPNDLPVDIKCFYKAAAEVAGDWYGYHYSEKYGQVILIVADVAGHGAGSAMMTSVVAGIYHEYISRLNEFEGFFPHEAFGKSLNSAFKKLSGGGSHVTLVSFSYDIKTKELTIGNNGHLSPLYYNSAKKKIKAITLPSDPCGLQKTPESKTKIKKITLNPNDYLISYTDALIETPIDNPVYSTKRVVKVLNNMQPKNASEAVKGLLKDFERQIEGFERGDDLCLSCFYVKS